MTQGGEEPCYLHPSELLVMAHYLIISWESFIIPHTWLTQQFGYSGQLKA